MAVQQPPRMSGDRLLAPAEVAELLHVSIATVYRQVRAGQLQALHVGRQVRVTPRAVADYLYEGRISR